MVFQSPEMPGLVQLTFAISRASLAIVASLSNRNRTLWTVDSRRGRCWPFSRRSRERRTGALLEQIDCNCTLSRSNMSSDLWRLTSLSFQMLASSSASLVRNPLRNLWPLLAAARPRPMLSTRSARTQRHHLGRWTRQVGRPVGHQLTACSPRAQRHHLGRWCRHRTRPSAPSAPAAGRTDPDRA